MRRFNYSILASACLLAACSKDTPGMNDAPIPDGFIGFNAHSAETRGTPVMGSGELTGFRTLALRHAGSWNDPDASRPASVFMNHIPVSQGSDGSWNYTPLRYWPSEGNITFFGYAPAASTDGMPNRQGLHITTPTDGSVPVITYTVPTAVADQPDLMVTTVPHQDLNRSNAGGSINMALSHALTCVGFRATGTGERITEIKVSGVAGSGSVALGSSPVAWTIDTGAAASTFTAGVNGDPLDAVSANILNDDGYLMMIPQTLTDQAQVTVTIDDGSKPYEMTFSLNIPGSGQWEAGRMVEYTFAVKKTGTLLLTPHSIVLPSIAYSYSSFSVICPEEDPNAAWTVSVPTDGWLQILDELPQPGLATGAYTYSGQGTTTLFAFAPEANPSATTELTSTIFLGGSSQTIAVRQMSKNEVYQPDTPADSWAGSNIYWVPDESYPEGGYLTFDDVGVTTHEQYQGVYFMWGSLVALSPVGNTWTGGVWNGTSGQIIYIPNPDPVTNNGWNPATSSGWGQIPRMGWQDASGNDTSSNPANQGTAANIPLNTLQSYLYQKHNPQGNVGDICKYLTDRGWAPGAREGRKWRMPINIEYNNTENDYTRIGTYAYQPGDDPFGRSIYPMGFRRTQGPTNPFFPAAGYRYDKRNGGYDTYVGYRPGEAISYWTSSPRKGTFGNSGDAFDFISDGTYKTPTNTQGFPRNTGATVRCVLEN